MEDVAAWLEREETILDEATALYHAGKLNYVHYSPFYDVQAIRCLAVRAHLEKNT